MTIFQMQDPSYAVGEWWIGRSADECLLAYMENYGMTKADVLEGNLGEQPFALSGEALDRLKFFDEETDTKRSFRKQLDREIAAGGKFPRQFACTEY